MAKSSKKTNIKQKRDTARAMAINMVAQKMGLSKVYIRKCVSGSRDCKTCDKVKKEYNRIKAKLDNTLANMLND